MNSHVFPVIVVVVVVVAASSTNDTIRVKNNVVVLSEPQQTRLKTEAYTACMQLMATSSSSNVTGKKCGRTWDNIMCWPEAEAGTISRQPCPRYIHGFRVDEEAVRTCQEDGTWFFNEAHNKTWTNFSRCISTHIPTLQPTNFSKLIASHLGNIEVMYRIGYSISLISLLLAVVIMIGFKRLHCPRNTVHVHLFISFILRASISLLKDGIFVRGVGLSRDLVYDEFGRMSFKSEDSHWQCKLLMVIFNFLMSTNYIWIFIEALYLHMLISVSVFSENSSVRAYIILGWTASLTFVVPWALVRLFMEDKHCWNTHPTEAYFWIIKAPIAATVLVNFAFFVNILRVLFTKLNAPHCSDARKFRYRKLAKSTLILIPLFGVHYIVFLGVPDNMSELADLMKLWFEMFFTSFQGFLVAVSFCFMNTEVKGELRKTWQRYRLHHGSLATAGRPSWTTLTTTLQRKRNSVNSDQSFADHVNGVRIASREASPKLIALKNAADQNGGHATAMETHQLLPPQTVNGNCSAV